MAAFCTAVQKASEVSRFSFLVPRCFCFSTGKTKNRMQNAFGLVTRRGVEPLPSP